MGRGRWDRKNEERGRKEEGKTLASWKRALPWEEGNRGNEEEGGDSLSVFQERGRTQAPPVRGGFRCSGREIHASPKG